MISIDEAPSVVAPSDAVSVGSRVFWLAIKIVRLQDGNERIADSVMRCRPECCRLAGEGLISKRIELSLARCTGVADSWSWVFDHSDGRDGFQEGRGATGKLRMWTWSVDGNVRAQSRHNGQDHT
jgi:hypothetical protein